MGSSRAAGLLRILLILLSQTNECEGWFFKSKDDSTNTNQGFESNQIPKEVVAEFSMEPLNSAKGMKLVENAKRMRVTSNSCWQNAYGNLFAGCSEIMAGEDKRSRFAWHLSDCFQKDSGRPAFPYCNAKSTMPTCLKLLHEDARKVYLEFFLETNSICHQLQADAFKRQMERLVNELKTTAENAEMKIENIEERAEHLLRSSNQIHDSLALVHHHTGQVAQTLKSVGDHVSTVLSNSEAVHEQFVGIAASHAELREGQTKMNETLEQGMTVLHDSYNHLGVEIRSLGEKAVEIDDQITKIGDAMSSKMNTLQSKAQDIENIAGVSLDKQGELLAGQSAAVEGLQMLNKVMSQALEESKGTMQQLAEFGHRQQEELLLRQKQLEQAHDHLVENSESILAAQEAFESKQANMFVAIDKLFTLHNAILLESRLIKAFIVYSIAIFILYMFTSTKQTYTIRPRLYMGLCVTFLIEFFVLKYWTNGIEHHAWITNLVRLLFVLLSTAQLLHAIFTYRDYETLNHQLLLTLMEKFDGMQRHKELSWDVDSEEEWSAWVDTDLPEDVDKLEDPDYVLPEEMADSTSTTTSITRRYNLRNRHHF